MNPFEGMRPRLRTVLLAVAAIAFVAVTLFRVPLATIFTLGLLLVCPLMMIGMHGGGHGANHSPADEAQTDQTDGKADVARRRRSALASPRRSLGTGWSTNDHRPGEQS